MANESPSASWHPALMPESHPFPPSSARPTSPPEQTPPTEPEEPTRVEAEEAPSALTDAGPSDRGSVSDVDAWLEPDDVHPEASIAPAESQAPDQLSGSEIQEPEHEVTSLHLQDTGREKVADAWLIEDDDAGAADAWLVPDDANTSASVAPAESQTLEQISAERPENELQDSRREATVDNCLSDEGDASAADSWLVPDDANTITPVVPQAFGQHPGEGPDHNLQDPRCEAIAHTCLSEERDAGAADAQLVPDNANTVAPAQSQALGQPPGEGPEHESQESGRKNTADAWLSEEGDASAPSAWLVSDDANLSMSIAPMQPQTPSHQPGDGPKHEAALPHLHGLGRENVAEAWLSEEGDASAVDAWITPDDAHPSASIAPQESVALDPLPDVETQEPEDEAAPPQPQDAGREAITDAQEPELPGLQMVTKEASSQPAHSQHSSSMSFARTVSHEVSFVDEDDAEWNLTRLGSDGSGSMPQLDPTASFPDVPPMPTSEENGSPQIPSAQAVQVIQEIERDTEMDEQPHLAARSQGQEPKPPVAQPEHAVELQSVAQAMDSEMQGSEAQDLEALYQEGVSFISDCDAKNNDTAAFADSFANEDVNDDFAQKLEPGVRAHEAESEVPPMERKSTTQAMGDLDSEPRSRFSTSNHTAGDPVTRSEESLNQSTACDAAGSSDLREDRDKVQPATEEDLTSKWQAAFAEDENDFLADDSAAGAEIHAAAFLGSDDEGLLDDDDLLDHDALSSAPAVSEARQPSESSPYIPSAVTSPQSSLPRAPLATSPLSNYPYQQPPPLVPFNSPQSQGQAAESRPQQPRVSSFADKSKGGCSSPYDLPTDLLSNTLKPRKRASMQQLPREQAPPPRSTSMFASGQSPAAGSLPSAPPSQGPGPSQRVPSHPSQAQSSFFQDLPITAKPRPSSRQSTTPQSPSPYAPGGQHLHPAPPLASPLSPPGPRSHTQPPGVGNLVAPEKVDPYAAIASAAASAAPPANVTSGYSPVTPQQAPSMGATPPAASTRYSPAPHAAVSPPSVDTTSRYSPASLQRPVSYGAPQSSAASSRYSSAPPGPRPGSSHAPATPAASAAPSQAAMPHMPRTSSPLAHYEAASEQLHRGANANGDAHADRRAISFDHRLNRVSSLPPTREVDEEDDDQMSHTYRSLDATLAKRPATIESKMAPAYRPAAPRKTPPPQSRSYGPPASSPQRASFGYMPQTTSAAHPGLVPPPRSSTQSPVAAQGGQQISTNFKSPPSAYEPVAPAIPKQAQPLQPTGTRKRGPSLSMNLVPPTDGTEHDPLQRWKGAPILSWRVGGTMATSFPKSATRYAMNQAAPKIQRTAGEVKVQNVRDVDPLADRLARFPGPLKGKSKKKEALAWLAAGIDAQERDIPDVPLHSQLSLEAKRGVERLLLWKLLRVFIEFDGALEGNANVEKAVKDVLAPETAPPVPDGAAAMPAASAGPSQTGPVTSMADSADPAAVEQIRLDLLRGNRETAVWSAVDKRLWGHAMLISHTVSPDLYKQVAQEFVRKEVNFPGHKNESIAALYKVFSGNSDDCVDELVPIHARVGLQLVSKQSALEPTRDAFDGLDKWRETLTLILNNRSSDDVRGLNALGKLLSSYGRAEAAHICFIFSRSLSVFSGLDDPKADFVLLGSDHRQQSEHFAKETEALQLSEVYEYGLSLAGGAAATAGAPHIAAYKLQHAATLADYGNRDKVLQYCDAIASAMVSQTRRSHHHHAILEAAVDDFMTRLKQAPKDASSSWISKPSMNKVSDSVWNRFNRFVAGDEGDVAGNGAAGEGESGPFAHLTTIPNMSRSPSVSNFETYGAGSPGYAANPAPPPTSGASSRYAPAPMQSAALGKPFSPTSQYTPASVSSGRASNEYSRNAYEPMHQGTNPSPTLNSNPYAPVTSTAVGAGSQPSLSDFSPGVPNGHGPSSVTQLPSAGGYQPLEPQGSPSIASPKVGGEATVYTPGQGYEPPTYGYKPQQKVSKVDDSQDGKDASGSGGFEPPSYQPYSYEPPSYHPDPEPSPEDGDEAHKPKKKSFMDDDEDDIPALRAATKSKAEKDRENEEMFRKAAEEDAKRAAAQQPAKKGWGFSGWFGGGGKKAAAGAGEASSPGKPIRAKLGEASSFVYDPDLKRWINKKPGAENTEAKKATPPPPPSSSTPPPAMTRSASHSGLASAPPGGPPGLSSGGPPSRPPSRPATSMSNASSIDDLLGVAATRKPGQKKPRKSGRYVDVMAK